jgi:hypothetical protein
MLSKTLANARLFHLRAAYSLQSAVPQPSIQTLPVHSRLFSSASKKKRDSDEESSFDEFTSGDEASYSGHHESDSKVQPQKDNYGTVSEDRSHDERDFAEVGTTRESKRNSGERRRNYSQDDRGGEFRPRRQYPQTFADLPVTTVKELNDALEAANRLVRKPLTPQMTEQVTEFDPKIGECLQQGIYDYTTLIRLKNYYSRCEEVRGLKSKGVLSNLISVKLSDKAFDEGLHERNLGFIINLLLS